jgi:hypothetical protein
MALLKQIITTTNDKQLDAFSNVLVALPAFVGGGQFTYDAQPLIYEQILAGDGTIVHDATERACILSINTATGSGDKAIMQSYQHYRYQAGRAQQIFITFNFRDNTGVTNLTKFARYGDSTNAIGFELNETTKQVFIRTGTTASNQVVTQANWNVDKLDGTGESGYTLDTSKTQILVIDLQALYVGRVRVGFDIDGLVIWAHEFLNANVQAFPYIQTANLPIAVGMESSGTTATNDTMLFICACVLSRGGQEKIAGFGFSASASITAGNGTRTHVLSVRPKTTFNSITNRIEFALLDLEILNTGSNPVKWELCLGQALTTPTYNDVNTIYSAFEFSTGAALSGSPAIVSASGFVNNADKGSGIVGRETVNRYPITLNAAGAVRDLGTLTLLAQGIGGTAAIQAQMHWKELR